MRRSVSLLGRPSTCSVKLGSGNCAMRTRRPSVNALPAIGHGSASPRSSSPSSIASGSRSSIACMLGGELPQRAVIWRRRARPSTRSSPGTRPSSAAHRWRPSISRSENAKRRADPEAAGARATACGAARAGGPHAATRAEPALHPGRPRATRARHRRRGPRAARPRARPRKRTRRRASSETSSAAPKATKPPSSATPPPPPS